MTATGAAEGAPRGSLALLRDPTFGPYFAGILASNCGTFIQNVAAILLVYDLTRSATMVGLVTAMQFLMQLALAPWTGMLADRMDRRALMLVGLGLGAVSAAALAVWVVAGLESPSPVLALVGLAGVGAAITGPAMHAALPGLVPRADLRQAVALHSITFNLARALGPALGAALYGFAGPAVAFAVNGASYGLFMLVLVRLRFVTRPERLDRSDRSLSAGLRHVRAHPDLLLWLAALAALGFAMEPVNTLSPLFIDAFGRGEALVGVLVSAFGLGSVLVAAGVGPLRRVLGGQWAGLMGLLVLAVGMAAFAFSPGPAVAIAALIVAGAGYLLGVSDLTATIQESIPDDLRGRVMALWTMAFLGSRPVAALAHGVMGDFVSPRFSTLVGAGVGLAAALAILRRARAAARSS